MISPCLRESIAERTRRQIRCSVISGTQSSGITDQSTVASPRSVAMLSTCSDVRLRLPRLRFVLEARWEQAGKPLESWVWPAATKSGHFEQSTIKKRHLRVLKRCQDLAKEEAKKSNGRPIKVRPFILYALRHTFLTRLGETGCDVWTLARIAGHSNIEIGSRYVHPSEQGQAVSKVFANQGGHKTRHDANAADDGNPAGRDVNDEPKGVNWRARRDSNSLPIAPEAIALSS